MTDSIDTPDVRELAAKAIQSWKVAERWPAAISYGIADAVLAAVTPVIRRQERAVVAEEIAADLETASGSLGWLPMRYDAAAIARSHTGTEET